LAAKELTELTFRLDIEKRRRSECAPIVAEAGSGPKYDVTKAYEYGNVTALGLCRLFHAGFRERAGDAEGAKTRSPSLTRPARIALPSGGVSDDGSKFTHFYAASFAGLAPARLRNA
jgi:hypothetical protein